MEEKVLNFAINNVIIDIITSWHAVIYDDYDDYFTLKANKLYFLGVQEFKISPFLFGTVM